MADAMFMFGVTAGIFAFLVAILFGSRARRRSHGDGMEETHESHGESHSSSGSSEGKKVKRYNSEGKPVNE